MAIVAILLAGIIGFAARMQGMRWVGAWLIGCALLPVLVLVSEIVMPPEPGGGASMWPIALAVGGLCGAIASGVGVFLAGILDHDAPR